MFQTAKRIQHPKNFLVEVNLNYFKNDLTWRGTQMSTNTLYLKENYCEVL